MTLVAQQLWTALHWGLGMSGFCSLCLPIAISKTSCLKSKPRQGKHYLEFPVGPGSTHLPEQISRFTQKCCPLSFLNKSCLFPATLKHSSDAVGAEFSPMRWISRNPDSYSRSSRLDFADTYVSLGVDNFLRAVIGL